MSIEDYHFSFIDKYFKETSLVEHHISSCDNFYDVSIPKIFSDMNPIRYYGIMEVDKYKYSARIYIGGKNTDKIYYGKPVVFDENNQHYMFPNEARLRNMTYGISIHYDVDIELDVLEGDEIITIEKRMPQSDAHYFLGMFPIMVQSKLCVLKNMPRETRFYMGECKNDYGGYFIIDGKEKVLIPQEYFGNNLIYTRLVNDNKHDFSVEIRSVSEDISKPRRTLAIRRVMASNSLSNEHLLVFIPDVRQPVPLFILMRALGILSDKDICKTILLDIEKNKEYLELLRPSIHDAGCVFNQKNALEYIGSFTKYQTIHSAYKCLVNQLLPHVGEMNFKAKACFIGHMIFELLKVIKKDDPPTDRDNYKYKRVQTTGELMKDLFIEYSKEMYTEIYKDIDKELYYHEGTYKDEEPVTDKNYKFLNLFVDEYFNKRIVEEGFRKGFKGNWGSKAHTKKVGVIQSLNRLTYHSFLSHMRRVDLDIDDSNKLVGPHLLHGSQFGLFDPIDVGGSVGIDKQMAVLCKFTKHISIHDITNWIQENMTEDDVKVNYIEEADYEDLEINTKLFINGVWIGFIKDPLKFKRKFMLSRRIGLLSPFISISFNMKYKTIYIFSDEGRVVRPLFYFDNHSISYGNKEKRTWTQCVNGLFNTKAEPFLSKKVLDGKSSKEIMNGRCMIEYLDNSEVDMCYITTTVDNLTKDHEYTHLEIHPSVMFGIMGNQVVFPENSALARNDYSCIQGRQAISIYHTNFLHRIDTTGVVINYGQKPLVKSRYTKFINNEEHPYGENAIVAIMAHTGYNVEDSILINESAVKRGLFNITYYSMYETYEETTKLGVSSEKRIGNVLNYGAKGTKPGYNYNELGENGIIKVNTIIDEKTVIIGRIQYSLDNPTEVTDASIFSSKGQSGIVDRVYLTDNVEGKRIAKVRIREERRPCIGDKFSSRCGQKGTIGTLIPEENMPFTKDGIRPDLIINPHCMPSRMTINQLIECLFCKMAVQKGTSIDSTPFVNKGSKHKLIGTLLKEFGCHSSGNEMLYNGMTGEQIESDIYMGPTYYTRLKHMTQDKINYRAGGPRVALTRQTNHGRSKDGGLKIGDMERDSIVSHGMSAFMCDSMMKRGDAYRMAICNHSGTIAIYNKEQNNFYSPIIDGPLAFEKIDSETLTPSLITKYGKEFSIVEVPYCLKLLIHELTAMNIQMRLITSDNIETLTSYGKHNLGKLNKFIERSESFVETKVEPKIEPEKPPKRVTINPTELDANEQRALIHDIERLKQNKTYTPEEEEKSKQSILALRSQLKEGNITQTEYNKLLIPSTNESVVSDNESDNASDNESVASDNASDNPSDNASDNPSDNASDNESVVSDNASDNESVATNENSVESTGSKKIIKLI
jgi:DNA-directed RNA polymerase II subunit RPB2